MQPLLDLLDSRRLRRLRHIASAYLRTNGEETDSQSSFLAELELIIQQHEQNMLPKQQSDNASLAQEKNEAVLDAHTQMQRDISMHPECMYNLQHEISVDELRVGNILDAQDYLGTWHVSIVIDENGDS